MACRIVYPNIKIKQLSPDATMPKYATEGAAGADLYAAHDIILCKGQPALVKCGFSMEMPAGYEAQVRSRSGLALKGVVVANSPGTIDSDYRGEVGVILLLVDVNTPLYSIKKGDRIAQMVVAECNRASFEAVAELSDTNRGSGGFGSTGK